MTDHSSHRDLLDGIFDLGARLQAALEAGDVDTVEAVVGQRGTLVERLVALPTSGAEDWTVLAALHKQQHADILAAATNQEKHLMAAQGVLRQVQQAQIQYGGRPVRPRFLNKDLCG